MPLGQMLKNQLLYIWSIYNVSSKSIEKEELNFYLEEQNWTLIGNLMGNLTGNHVSFILFENILCGKLGKRSKKNKGN